MPKASKKKVVGQFFCEGFDCDWAWTRSGFNCTGGGGGCEIANLVQAEETYFHPAELEEATKKINRILSKIGPDPKGRKLSFAHTHLCVLLAWCSHTGKPRAKSAVTRHDNPDKVVRALKLKVKQ